MRDYGEEVNTIWDGDPNCEHEWKYINEIEAISRGYSKPGKKDCIEYRETNKVKNMFCIKCGAYYGQLGLEPTFDLFIKHLCDIFDEIKRVLKSTGTVWVNMGDTYGQNWRGGIEDTSDSYAKRKGNRYWKKEWGKKAINTGVPSKSLCQIPSRFAIEMTNRGWILRQDCIWVKGNPMPESVKDRFTKSYEHIFMFVKSNKTQYWTNRKTKQLVTKQPPGTAGKEGVDWEWKEVGHNYSDSDTKIEPESAEMLASPRARRFRIPKLKKVSLWTGHDYWFEQQFEEHKEVDRRTINGLSRIPYGGKGNPTTRQFSGDASWLGQGEQGRNKRDVFFINTQSWPEAHFSVFPPALPEICIKAGCPEFICKKCGKAREKIYDVVGRHVTESMRIAGCDKNGNYRGTEQKDYDSVMAQRPSDTKRRILESMSQVKNFHYSSCGCNAGFTGGVVLDPFVGSGTTGVVAKRLGRHFIGIDISPKYCEMARKRLKGYTTVDFKMERKVITIDKFIGRMRI